MSRPLAMRGTPTVARRQNCGRMHSTLVDGKRNTVDCFREAQVRLRRNAASIAGRFLFALGVLLGVVFFGSAVWADIEAFLFDASQRADAPLTSLHCPVLITPREVGEIRATFENTLEWTIKPRVYFHVTDGFVSLIREEALFLELAPGEKRQLTWQVTTDDAAWEYFILARVYQAPAYPLPSRTSACGVLALDVPFLTGGQLVLLTLLALALLLGGGFYLWYRAHRPLEGRLSQEGIGRAALMGLIALGTVFGLVGLWLPGLICAILIVLVIVVLLARAAMETA